MASDRAEYDRAISHLVPFGIATSVTAMAVRQGLSVQSAIWTGLGLAFLGMIASGSR